VLQASSAIYRIYAPSTHALPAIRATTGNVELQLDCLDDGASALPSLGIRDLWAPTGVKPIASSFYLLGHSLEQHPIAPRLNELNISTWKPLLSEVSEFASTSPPRILICGRRSSGLSTLVRCIINCLITKQLSTSRSPSEVGVALLDLDSSLPQFAPPGTISLVHLRRPVFGPPFSNLLFSPQSMSGQLVKMHFLGDADRTEVNGWHLPSVGDLLNLQSGLRKEHKHLPVIVVMPQWLSDIDQNLASMLWNKIAPSHFVSLGPSLPAPHLEPWRSLAEYGNCCIHQLPAQVSDKVTMLQEHELQMQSYFHLQNTQLDRPFWDESPLLATRRRTLDLSYGDDQADIHTITLLGGHVALEDTYEAICGSLVALVAVQATEDLLDQGGEVGMNSSGKIQWTGEDLPRWQGQDAYASSFPFSAESSFCLGLALVHNVDIPGRIISFIAGPDLHVHDIQEQGYRVALVIQKATSDGRFKTEWVQREMGHQGHRVR
jgi:polynucleotide 5'-hydroxyl-kinase GRC3/NOL9